MSAQTVEERVFRAAQVQPPALQQVRTGKTTPLAYQVQVYRRLDEALAAVADVPGQSLACKAGCGLCCHYHVYISASEALALAEHVSAKFSAVQRAVLEAKLKSNADQAAALGLDKHMKTNIACAFLTEANMCGVYEVRPSACRRHHSYDFTPCKTTFDDPAATDNCPQSMERLAVAEGMGLAACNAQVQAGFDVLRYEMSGAVWEALTNRSSAKRWRDGKVSFPTVKDRAAPQQP